MKLRKRYIALTIAAAGVAAAATVSLSGPRPGHVVDEAVLAGRNAASLNPIPHVDLASDYFHDMDRGVALDSKAEVNGRNMWILWTGGNDRFWDTSATLSFGNVDLVKIVSSYNPDLDSTVDNAKKEQLKKVYKFRRSNRWDYLGAVNEPCFREAPGPDAKRFGLWLDRRADGCAPRSVRGRNEIPRRETRRAREKYSSGLLLWIRFRRGGPAPVSQSGVR